MKPQTLTTTLLLTLAATAFAQAPATRPAESADAMLGKIKNLKPPEVDESKVNDKQYVAAYIEKRDAWVRQLNDLVAAFYAAYPDHEQALPLMTQRWIHLAQADQTPTVMKETDAALAATKDDKKRADILFVRGVAGIMTGKADAGQSATDAFIKAAPRDSRGAELLFHLADNLDDPKARAALYQRIVKEYPDADEATSAKTKIRLADAIGKPFDLAFTDAITGKKISVQDDLKGKVVVIDFWATWCGPCVAEMPKNKELYAKYKDKGVEFIGVSLDQPPPDGLKALKAFVAENAIPWPQYYQGNYWDSEFSKSWGIDSIPAVFIVDKQGKLSSTEARGKLDTLIPELLAK
jgi:thiol-disulfide isomerase/thioredoxin